MKNFSLFHPTYNSFYKGEDYRNVDEVVVADFLYLRRDKLLFWKLERYESSFRPYYPQDDLTIDDAYESLKQDVMNGDVEHGVSPEYERELLNTLQKEMPEKGEMLDFIQSPDGEKTVEFRAGDKFGENYLVVGETEKDLDIKNVTNAVWSQDGKYLIYSTGELVEILGILSPKADIWRTDDQGNKKLLLEVSDSPNDMDLYSDGKVVVYASKNKIGILSIDGENHRVLTTYDQPNGASEQFFLAHITALDDEYVYVEIPNVDYGTTQKYTKWKIEIQSGLKYRI